MSISRHQFEELCQRALADAGSLSPGGKQCVIEDLRIRFEHPGEYVAYLDCYKLVNNVYRLTRKILAHSPTPEGIQSAFEKCPKDALGKLVIDYADPLGDDIEAPCDIEGR